MFGDIYTSYRAMPMWVQVWVGIILVPVNCLSLVFWGAPSGAAVAILAVGGMAPNAILMFGERGFSKAMALSHLVFWLPLLVLGMTLLSTDPEVVGTYQVFLIVLLVVDAISLGFDFPDALKWIQGDRSVAGK